MSVTKTLCIRADVTGTDGTHSYRSVRCTVQWKHYRYPEEFNQKYIGIFLKLYTPPFYISLSKILSLILDRRWARITEPIYPYKNLNLISYRRQSSANRFLITPCERVDYDDSKRL